MSGGSYDYVSYKIEGAAAMLRQLHPDQSHVLALADLLNSIADVMHDVEWADSHDTSWTEALDAKIRAVVDPEWELAAATDAAQRALHGLQAALKRVEDQ